MIRVVPGTINAVLGVLVADFKDSGCYPVHRDVEKTSSGEGVIAWGNVICVPGRLSLYLGMQSFYLKLSVGCLEMGYFLLRVQVLWLGVFVFLPGVV